VAPNAFLPEMSTLPTSAMHPTPAADFVRLLEAHGATHVLTVPDNTSAPLLAALESGPESGTAEGDENRTIRVIYATREGEAIGIASGLWLGGALPVVLIQNTGLLEAGDGLRGTAARMGAPIPLLITCRGYAKARSRGIDPSQGEVDRDTLVRSDLDSVAHMTEATLKAWGIPFRVLRDPTDLAPVSEAFVQAQKEERPVAVLLDTAFE
jgi:sulfopyruvate decarboxylase subunit alpha